MSATSPHVFFLSGEPFTVQVPPAKSRSCSLASSRCAAIFRPFSLILSRHLTMALPPTHAERLPYVPIPNGICAVSPWTISTCSIGMPSSSATSWANVVSCPCPCECDPVYTVTAPAGWTRTWPDSQRPAPAPSESASADGGGPQCSRYVLEPLPVYLPFGRSASCSLRVWSYPTSWSARRSAGS